MSQPSLNQGIPHLTAQVQAGHWEFFKSFQLILNDLDTEPP